MSYTQTLIKAEAVAEMLGVSPKTVYNGGYGTDKLTRVRAQGCRTVRFIKQEVEKLLHMRISHGQKVSGGL